MAASVSLAELSGWSKNDKLQFLLALKSYGDSDLEAVQSRLPDKSIIDIRNAVTYYKKAAQSKLLISNGKELTDEVEKWIDILQKLHCKQSDRIQDLIPRVLKYIAMFEKRTDKSDINLSEAYMFLSDMSLEKSTKELSDRTGYFLYRCLVRLAENLHKDDIEEAQLYLKQLENFEELGNLSADGSMMNPLNIPDNLLKLSTIDTNEDITQ